MILLKATYRSSITSERIVAQQWLSKRATVLGFRRTLSRDFAAVQMASSFLWDIAPTRIQTPDHPARNLVTIPTALPTVEAEFVETFGVCLEGLWKVYEETGPEYRHPYIKWGWVGWNELSPPPLSLSSNTNCFDIRAGHLPNILHYRYGQLATTK